MRSLGLDGTENGTHLEEVFAQMIGNHHPQRRELAHTSSTNFECNVEKTESHQPHRVGVLLIVRVQE